MCFILIYSAFNKLSEHIYFYIFKTLLYTLLFLVFKNLGNLQCIFKPSFLIYISEFFLFCLLVMDQVSGRFGILSSTFPSLSTLFFQFWSTMNTSQYQRDIVPVLSLPPRKLTLVLLSARIIFFSFHIKLYILNLQISWVDQTYVFSTSVHVFRNLFWKIYPLFEQISF